MLDYKSKGYGVEAMARLNGTITEEQKAEFEAIGKELGLSNQGQIIGALLKAYRELQEVKESMQSDFQLSDDEQELLSKAVEYSGMSRNEIIKRGAIAEAKKTVSLVKHQADLENLSDEELKKKTFAGVAALRIQQVIEKVMTHNDNQPEKQNKFFISPSLIFKLAGSNRAAINNYFEKYQLSIDDHNHKHNLTVDDNRKGKGIDAKEVIGV